MAVPVSIDTACSAKPRPLRLIDRGKGSFPEPGAIATELEIEVNGK